MEIPGTPYSEPSFSSIALREAEGLEREAVPDVEGAAYLITDEQYRQVIASEGGGIAYRDTPVLGVPIHDGDLGRVGNELSLRTFTSALIRRPTPSPSQRYMVSSTLGKLELNNPKYFTSIDPLTNHKDLLKDGARELHLPQKYQAYLANITVYKPSSCRRTKLGASIFIFIWRPILVKMESLTKANFQKDGNVPLYIAALVRTVFQIMWISHDYIFAPVFGRGDGVSI